MSFLFVIFATLLITVTAQRPSFAGSRTGSGYKDGLLQNNNDVVGNRNSDDNSGGMGTTTRNPNLPYDAHGDSYLVNYWNSVPFEQRPFWIVNQQAIEAHRGTPSRRPIESSTLPNAQNPPNSQPTANTQNFANRINADGNLGFNTFNNVPNVGSQPDVVYPSNITPEQRIDMEIQFLQQRLDSLQQIRGQLQQRVQQSFSNSPNSQSQRNF